MILALAVLLFPATTTNPGSASAARPPMVAAVASGAATDAKKSKSEASDPAPPDIAEAQPSKTIGTVPLASTASGATKPVPAPLPDLYLPLPRIFQPQTEPLKHPSRAWFVLMATEHSAAGFDAWSTRQGVSQGRVETDPLMRPFAHSGAIYGAIQVVPFGLDYVAHRMQRSSGWTRHVWWLPQSLATASFLFSGSYNFSHLH